VEANVRANQTLLIAAGNIGSEAKLATSIAEASRIIAVDGGLSHLNQLGICPRIVIGDLDSAEAQHLQWAEANGAEIIHQKNQENSDLSKALNLCFERQWNEVNITGIEGGRIDHQLGAMAAISDAPQNLNIIASLTNAELIRITANQKIEIDFSGTFSLFSFGQSIVTLSGAEWNLENDVVTFSTKGISNQSENHLDIEVKSGNPLIFIGNN
jgi:thiamine pyrophosphokinase